MMQIVIIRGTARTAKARARRASRPCTRHAHGNSAVPEGRLPGGAPPALAGQNCLAPSPPPLCLCRGMTVMVGAPLTDLRRALQRRFLP